MGPTTNIPYLWLCLLMASVAAVTSLGIDGTDVSSTVLAYYSEGTTHRSGRAPIFEHKRNSGWDNSRKRYYVFPQFRVDPDSISAKSSSILNKHYVQFDVVMFDQCYLQKVASYLSIVVDAPVQRFQVAPYDLRQVKLVWADHTYTADGLTMDQAPIPQTSQLPETTLRINAKNREKARAFVQELKNDTSLFDHFRLQYSLTAAETATHLITVKTESATQTEFYSALENKMGHSSNVYLSSDDLNDFSQQTLQNVVASEYRDAAFVTDSQTSITVGQLIKQAMVQDKTLISTSDDQRWGSVFWEDFYSQTFSTTSSTSIKALSATSAIMKKMSCEEIADGISVAASKIEFRNYLSKHNAESRSGGGSVSFGDFSLGGNGASTDEQSSVKEQNEKLTTSEDQMRQWLLQNHNNVERTGQKFQVKPMQLSRVNLNKLRSSTSLAVSSVQSQKVRIDGTAKLQILHKTAENCSQLDEAWDHRLSDMERALKQTQTTFKNENENLEQQSAELKSAVATLQSSIASLQTNDARNSWLRTHRYCVWKMGNCPAGFQSFHAYSHGIETHRNDGRYTNYARWGGNGIKHHSDGRNKLVDIDLKVCCKSD